VIVNPRRSAERGLTLVETLIAAVILFAAIAFAADSYRGSMSSSLKAADKAELLAPLPLVMAQIGRDLRAKASEPVSGAGLVLGVSYTYEASVIEQRAPPDRFNIDFDVIEEYKPRFFLYRVRLQLRYRGSVESFTYQELAWSSLERA
jgi:Tfp pilus assembly protein PilV